MSKSMTKRRGSSFWRSRRAGAPSLSCCLRLATSSAAALVRAAFVASRSAFSASLSASSASPHVFGLAGLPQPAEPSPSAVLSRPPLAIAAAALE